MLDKVMLDKVMLDIDEELFPQDRVSALPDDS